MKFQLVAVVFSALTAFSAIAAEIVPETTELPWKNGPVRDSIYKFSENATKVHVLEAWRIDCSWCNRNAAQVKALANEYATDADVQFLDLGLDANDSAYTQWIARHTPSFPVVKDTDRAVWNALHSEEGVPQTFVVDCAGNLVDYTVGYWGQSEKDAIKAAIAVAKDTTCP